MHWVTNYYNFWQRQWYTWQSSYDMTQGHYAYAEHQETMWGEMGEQARQLFKGAWADFDSDMSVFT